MSVHTRIKNQIAKGLIPKEALDIMLCHFMKRMLAAKRQGLGRTHYQFLRVACTERFRMKNRYILISPKGKALCLLKTQVAKKPKNPV